MIVPALTRTDGNGTVPCRHSWTRTGDSPSVSTYHVNDFSTSVQHSTRWSNPVIRSELIDSA